MKQFTQARTSICALLCLFGVCFSAPLRAADWPQWRGPHRTGISEETGLLKQWPSEGPKLVWQLKDIGSGYSTPSIVGDRIYLLSNRGLQDEFVQALADNDGHKLWSTHLGKVGNPDQQPNYPGARSTPTVDGAVLYVLGSDGDLACVETSGGKIRWQKNLRADFGGRPGAWAYSESPLVDGDVLVCTPGGTNATLVALNKKTGVVIWKCAVPGSDDAAYASAIVIETGGVKQYVQLLQKGLVGVDAKTGKFLWRYPKPISRYATNIPTPVADDGSIFCASPGTGAGMVHLKANAGKFEPDEAYFSSKLPTALGGEVKLGDYLYGTSQALQCVDFKTGAVRWEERSLGPSSLCAADGRLYLHGENGLVALVEATPDGYHEKGRFTPPDQPEHGSAKSWPYPVISSGRLYFRDAGTLWCYDVKEH